MPKYFDEYEAIITKNPIILERTVGVGVMSKELGLSYDWEREYLENAGQN